MREEDLIYCRYCEQHTVLDDEGYCDSCGNHFENIISPAAKKLIMSGNNDDFNIAMELIRAKPDIN